MYVSPEGRQFAHAVAAVAHVFETRPDLATYYADYAPMTCQWIRYLERSGDINRKTRFDPFLARILRRAGYKEQAHVE